MIAQGQVDGPAIVRALHSYADLLYPWARTTAQYMVADVERRNEKQWRQHSADIGRALRKELEQAPTGLVHKELVDQSAELIRSMPIEAARQVEALVRDNMPTGIRSKELIPKILELGAKTEAKARLIARTEVARASSLLTQARAQHLGSEGYIWRTVGDGDVRDSHAEMEGKYVRWDTVPRLSDGTQTHAGQIYNCRCYPEPVLPDF